MTKGGLGKSNRVNITTSAGTQRTYLLHIPTNYSANTPTPLLFSFHGRSDTGSMQEQISQFSDESYNPNMLAVYPDGMDQQWQGDPASVGVDDVGFTMDMMASLENQFCIDTNKIYSSGFSNGAGFSLNILACDSVASTKIAAFAGSSSADYQGATDQNCDGTTIPITCSPGRKDIPIFETHGSADPVIAYDGGPRRGRCLPTIPRFITAWAQRNGLDTSNVTTSLFNGNVLESTFGASSELPGLVTHYNVNGMGHTWPSISAGNYIDGTSLVLAFFTKYSLGQATSAAPSSTFKTTSTPASTVAATSSTSKSTSTSVSTLAVSSSSKVSSVTTTSTTSSTHTTVVAPSTIKASSVTPTSTTPVATDTSQLCPSSNGTVYTDSNSGKYTVLCAYDNTAPPMQSVIYTSFVNCMTACSSTTGCKSVAYNGACYLKASIGDYITKGTNVARVAVRVG